MKENNIPDFISFNYSSGYDFAEWLIKMDIEEKYKFPEDFNFKVHSTNYIEKNNIESILNNYLHFNIEVDLKILDNKL